MPARGKWASDAGTLNAPPQLCYSCATKDTALPGLMGAHAQGDVVLTLVKGRSSSVMRSNREEV
jgi:hypothetical protein